MSTQFLPSETLAQELKLTVSFRLLLGLYAVIPFCILLQQLDNWLWHGALQESLPSTPTQFLLFQILFGTPHIIASSILLASNKDYFDFYKPKIMMMTLALALVFGVGSLFIPYRIFYVAVACWTVYHVLKQQLGVARGVCSLSNRAFYTLLWLSVSAGIFIYLGIFLKNSLDVHTAYWLKHIAAILCACLVICTLRCQEQVGKPMGKCFLWANTLLVVGSFYLFVQQYYFFAILMPRLVHDATAYIFYVTHDYNKNRAYPQNLLYRCADRCKIHTLLVLPLSSFLLAYGLQTYGDWLVNAMSLYLFDVEIHKVITVGLLGYLALMHYYTEAFAWKHGSPLRKYIAFSK